MRSSSSKRRNAIFFENEGKNNGCWVMRIDTEGYDDDKIIVRSNGTVTYVGKDIAYQLWKFGLLEPGLPLPATWITLRNVWVTTSTPGEPHSSDVRPWHAPSTTSSTCGSRICRTSFARDLLGLGYEEQVKQFDSLQLRSRRAEPGLRGSNLALNFPPEDQKRPSHRGFRPKRPGR